MSLRNRPVKEVRPVGVRQFMVVGCGQTLIAFPAEIVRGIEACQPATTHEAGERVSAINRIFRSEAESTDARLILLGDTEVRETLRVDFVGGLSDVDRTDIRPLPPHFTGLERTWFRGVLVIQKRIVLLADPVWLLSTKAGDAAVSTALVDAVDGRAASTASETMTGREGIIELANLEVADDAEDAPWAEL